MRPKRSERSAAKRSTDLTLLVWAIFIEMFGDPVANPYDWPVVRLGEVLMSATYGTSKKSGATGRFPVLRMGNITVDGRLNLDDMKFVNLDRTRS